MSVATSDLVFVTGASGFVGRVMIAALLARGWRVRAGAREPGGLPHLSGLERVAMPDLTARPQWQEALAGVTHVVHLAGIAHSRAPIPEATYQRVNAEAAGALARAAGAAGVRRFVFMSSIRAQSGPSCDTPLTERMAPMPTDAYGRSKLAGEAAVAAELAGAACSLRPTLVVGPGVKGNLGALRRLALAPIPLPFGALHNRRSLMGLGNLVSITQFALTDAAAAGQLFVAADPELMSVAELVAAMRRAVGRDPRLIPVPLAVLKPVMRLAGRGNLAASLMGDLIVDASALATAGWRPISSSKDEIFRMMTGEHLSSG